MSVLRNVARPIAYPVARGIVRTSGGGGGGVPVDYSIALDTGSNGTNHGTLTNFADPQAARSTTIPPVLTGRSLLFNDAALEHIVLASEIPAAPVSATYAAWVRKDDVANSGPIFGKPGSTSYIGLVHTTDLYIGDGLGGFNSWPVVWVANTWYHVAITVTDAVTIELWLDGVSQGTRTMAAGLTAVNRIGGDIADGRYLSGFLDDARYYDAVLTGTQILDLVSGVA